MKRKEIIKYYSISDTTKKKRVKKQKPDNWKLFYANIRGIRGKKACVNDVFSELSPDIALFTETLLSDNVGIKFQGYTFFGKAREKNKGGGVGICVKNDKKSIVSPHHTDRDIEILWVSIKRKDENPLFIGVYYGKQETTVSNEKIKEEMDLLSEEILEIRKEGEVILCMDANAKIGLMGE